MTTQTLCATTVAYTIAQATTPPEGKGLWHGRAWGSCESLCIPHFHSASQSIQPVTQAKMLYDSQHLHVLFRVEDHYTQSFYTNYQDPVCQDSCVEIFLQPRPDSGYFNFEVNCGGTSLIHYTRFTQRPDSPPVRRNHPLPWSLGKTMRVYHDMPRTTPAAITHPQTWHIELAIPLAIFESQIGPLYDLSGQTWRGNVYKCFSHVLAQSHWASWSPIGPVLDFHTPQYFAPIGFA